MANQIETLTSLLRGSEIAERLSPAASLSLVVGFDQDDWGDWLIFSVGDRVLAGDRLYKVLGFTLDDHIIVRPIGLDVDPMIETVELTPMGLQHEPSEWVTVPCHKDGLIDLVG